MRLLLDECVPARLKRALPGHEVSTVAVQGWSGVKNGKLLVLDTVSNELGAILPLVPALEAALVGLPPGGFVLVQAPPEE